MESELHKRLYSRVDNIDRIRKAYIMWRDIVIAELYHEYCSDSGLFDWVIRPIWKNWDAIIKKYDIYIDIAGIDDTVRKYEYIRAYTPEFVSQRIIPCKRADYIPMLKKIHLTHRDDFEILCRTHGICGNDDLYVSRTPDKVVDIHSMESVIDIPDFDTSKYGWIKRGKNDT